MYVWPIPRAILKDVGHWCNTAVAIKVISAPQEAFYEMILEGMVSALRYSEPCRAMEEHSGGYQGGGALARGQRVHVAG